MLIACGLSHKTAPLHVRERVVFEQDQLIPALQALTRGQMIQEATILSTCNRTEIYCDLPVANDDYLIEWLASYQHLTAAELRPYWYCYQDTEAIKHILGVAGGLDSMIVGEPQIFGQLKQAVQQAKLAGTIGVTFRHLFDHAFAVGKKIRTETHVNRHPVSMGYLTIHLMKRIFADYLNCRILLIGSGDTIVHVAQYLHRQGMTNLVLANRTIHKAHEVATLLNAQVIAFDELNHHLMKADAVVTATRSRMPLLGKGMVETALKARRYRPMLMIDLAVPRNIEPEIQELSDVYLYTLDTLQNLIKENQYYRLEAVQAARLIIEHQTQHFLAEAAMGQTRHLITAYRTKMKKIRDQTLAKALQELALGDTPTEVIEKLSYQLTNKLIHDTCVNLRQATYSRDTDLLARAQKLLGLSS